MANEKTFPVRIVRGPYVFRGRSIPVGTVVQVTEAQFRAMTRVSPPYAERVEAGSPATPVAEAGEPVAAPKERPASKK
jgi:hypothetical protein